VSSASRPAISVQAAAAVLSAVRLWMLFAASASDLQGFSVAGLDRVVSYSS
jgi:hypothetical protein